MPDAVVNHCPTCGAKVPNWPFKVGDRVRHMHGYEGVVTRVGAAVEVRFDHTEELGDLNGRYDRGWFESFPNGLAVVVNKD